MAKYIVQMRRGTADQWEKSGIIPRAGELVVEIDELNNLHKLKIGDGIHAYTELAYLMAGDEIVTQVLAQALPRIITVTLDVDKWEEVTSETDDMFGCYGQKIDIADITSHSRLDLQPDVNMLAEFKNLNLSFVTENNAGVISVYSVGDMPLKTYTMQATITETEVVVECDKVVGTPVGAPASTSGSNHAEINSRIDTLDTAVEEIHFKLEEIEARPQIIIDSTLTQSGQAADAKAVGDAIDVLTKSTNVEDVEQVKELLDYINANGAEVTNMVSNISANTQAIADHEAFAAETYETKTDADGKLTEAKEYTDSLNVKIEELKETVDGKANKATTLAGYGIANAATADEADRLRKEIDQSVTIATFKTDKENTYISFDELPGVTSIDWGDGKVNSQISHSYEKVGILYVCKIYDVTALTKGFLNGRNNLTSIKLGNSITSITTQFADCANLTHVTIPGSVTAIGGNSFYNCKNLHSVEIADGVSSIGSKAFYGCTNLVNITIPKSIESIEDSAFAGCSGLVNITFANPEPVRYSELTPYNETWFAECTSLTKIFVPHDSVAIYKTAWPLVADKIDTIAHLSDVSNAKTYTDKQIAAERTYTDGKISAEHAYIDGQIAETRSWVESDDHIITGTNTIRGKSLTIANDVGPTGDYSDDMFIQTLTLTGDKIEYNYPEDSAMFKLSSSELSMHNAGKGSVKITPEGIVFEDYVADIRGILRFPEEEDRLVTREYLRIYTNNHLQITPTTIANYQEFLASSEAEDVYIAYIIYQGAVLINGVGTEVGSSISGEGDSAFRIYKYTITETEAKELTYTTTTFLTSQLGLPGTSTHLLGWTSTEEINLDPNDVIQVVGYVIRGGDLGDYV